MIDLFDKTSHGDRMNHPCIMNLHTDGISAFARNEGDLSHMLAPLTERKWPESCADACFAQYGCIELVGPRATLGCSHASQISSFTISGDCKPHNYAGLQLTKTILILLSD
jgi:hypothetical protein